MVDQTVCNDVRRALILAAVEYPFGFFVGELFDFFQQRRLQRCLRGNEQVHAHRSPGGDLLGFKGFDAVVFHQIQKFKLLVKIHVSIMTRSR